MATPRATLGALAGQAAAAASAPDARTVVEGDLDALASVAAPFAHIHQLGTPEQMLYLLSTTSASSQAMLNLSTTYRQRKCRLPRARLRGIAQPIVPIHARASHLPWTASLLPSLATLAEEWSACSRAIHFTCTSKRREATSARAFKRCMAQSAALARRLEMGNGPLLGWSSEEGGPQPVHPHGTTTASVAHHTKDLIFALALALAVTVPALAYQATTPPNKRLRKDLAAALQRAPHLIPFLRAVGPAAVGVRTVAAVNSKHFHPAHLRGGFTGTIPTATSLEGGLRSSTALHRCTDHGAKAVAWAAALMEHGAGQVRHGPRVQPQRTTGGFFVSIPIALGVVAALGVGGTMQVMHPDLIDHATSAATHAGATLLSNAKTQARDLMAAVKTTQVHSPAEAMRASAEVLQTTVDPVAAQAAAAAAADNVAAATAAATAEAAAAAALSGTTNTAAAATATSWWARLQAAAKASVGSAAVWMGFCVLLYKGTSWLIEKLNLSPTAKSRLRTVTRVVVSGMAMAPKFFWQLMSLATGLGSSLEGDASIFSLGTTLATEVKATFFALLSAASQGVSSLWSQAQILANSPEIVNSLSKHPMLWGAATVGLSLVAVVSVIAHLRRRQHAPSNQSNPQSTVTVLLGHKRSRKRSRKRSHKRWS